MAKTGTLPQSEENECRHSLNEEMPAGCTRLLAGELRRSRAAADGCHTERQVEQWLAERLANPRLSVQQVPLADMQRWLVDPQTGNISHESGMFFTITGIQARHRSAAGELKWDQPIIDQPEIGILGILVKEIDGVLHFCLQAKEEPGNINSVQLSPTVQATYSNYTQAHGGQLPPLVEYFLMPRPGRTLFAKLQTEDGGRFLYKSNRNMIVRVDDHELNDLPREFIWLTLGQIARLIRRDNLIHACARSILSALVPATVNGIGEGGTCRQSSGTSLEKAIQWLDDSKAGNHILVKRVGLNTLQEWEMDGKGNFSHREKRFFSIIGLNVQSSGREVSRWSQPVLNNPERGVIGLLTQMRGGERYFLMQAKAEPGNRSTVQIGPTVQFTPGNYLENSKLQKPFLFDEFSGAGVFPTLWENYQSEEGARFFQESHLHRVKELPDGMSLSLPPEFLWLSESQLQFFLHLGEAVNSCARSVISCLI